MYVLLAASLTATAIVLLKVVQFATLGLRRTGPLDEAAEFAVAGESRRATELLAGVRHPAAAVLSRAISVSEDPAYAAGVAGRDRQSRQQVAARVGVVAARALVGRAFVAVARIARHRSRHDHFVPSYRTSRLRGRPGRFVRRHLGSVADDGVRFDYRDSSDGRFLLSRRRSRSGSRDHERHDVARVVGGGEDFHGPSNRGRRVDRYRSFFGARKLWSLRGAHEYARSST